MPIKGPFKLPLEALSRPFEMCSRPRQSITIRMPFLGHVPRPRQKLLRLNGLSLKSNDGLHVAKQLVQCCFLNSESASRFHDIRQGCKYESDSSLSKGGCDYDCDYDYDG